MLVNPKKDIFYEKNQKVSMEKEAMSTLWAHDPGIFKDGGYYYVFSTHNCQIRKSKDLINWEWLGHAFDKVPENAVKLTGVETLWAPDIIKIGKEYWIYYSASTFGKTKSLIGLAKSENIEGPYKDCGVVIQSFENSDFNAIDANIIYDKEGKMWMAYGSFWTGIYLIELNKITGFTKEDVSPIHIAGRNKSVDRAIEGPYIIYNEEFDKYYLFVSYDSLFRDYHVRVGRADNITGPYFDINGVKMTDLEVSPNFVGNKVLGAYRFKDSRGWLAPGHNSVLKDEKGYFIIHHARDGENKDLPYLHVRKIFWSKEGWPMVSPERYAGEENRKIITDEIIGNWEFLIQDKENHGMIESQIAKFENSGKISKNELVIGSWVKKDNNFSLTFDELGLFEGILSEAWDWEKDKETIIFTGINFSGLALWCKRG